MVLLFSFLNCHWNFLNAGHCNPIVNWTVAPFQNIRNKVFFNYEFLHSFFSEKIDSWNEHFSKKSQLSIIPQEWFWSLWRTKTGGETFNGEKSKKNWNNMLRVTFSSRSFLYENALIHVETAIVLCLHLIDKKIQSKNCRLLLECSWLFDIPWQLEVQTILLERIQTLTFLRSFSLMILFFAGGLKCSKHFEGPRFKGFWFFLVSSPNVPRKTVYLLFVLPFFSASTCHKAKDFSSWSVSKRSHSKKPRHLWVCCHQHQQNWLLAIL